MDTNRIRFGEQPESPVLQGQGIVISVTNHEYPINATEHIWIHGCCRMAKDNHSGDRKDLIKGIFITAIEMFRQQPVTANMIGPHLVFDDDVEDTGSDYLVFFSFNLFETVPIPKAPFSFIVHASFFQHISNFLFIRFTA